MAIYQIPKEINSPTELIRGFHFEQFAFVALYFLVFYLFQGFVHNMLIIPYYIFNVLVALALIAPCKSPKRNNLSLFIYQMIKSRDEKIYHGKQDEKKPVMYR